jgi:hypothetical protein
MKQLSWNEYQRMVEINTHFADMVNDPVNPLTNEDLAKLVKRNPAVWGRFKGLTGTLKED